MDQQIPPFFSPFKKAIPYPHTFDENPALLFLNCNLCCPIFYCDVSYILHALLTQLLSLKSSLSNIFVCLIILIVLKYKKT